MTEKFVGWLEKTVNAAVAVAASFHPHVFETFIHIR
jgi:hypothetical protein